MAETYTLGLALFNFIPNLIFLVGASFLVRLVHFAAGGLYAWLTVLGAVLIGTGGMLKAAWKLIFVMGVADIQWMCDIQFILIAPGFLLLLTAVFQMLRPKPVAAVALPALLMAGWKVPFLVVMTLTSMGTHGILFSIAIRNRATLAAAGFLVALLCLLAMGALAGGEQTLHRQWMEEIINAAGQTGFAVGAWLSSTRIQAHR